MHEVKYRFEIYEVLRRLKIDHSQLRYKEALKQVNPQSWFSLYDHNVRPGLTKIEYIVDHHDHTNPTAKKYLITRMGSALTHIYYLMNPSQLDLIKPSNQE
jgi:hypothetical protein